MDKIIAIDSKDTDYYQWGVNCRILRYSEKVTKRIIQLYQEYTQEFPKQTNIDLFWQGYHNK